MSVARTLEICSLFLAKHCADLADPCCQGDFEVAGHDLLALVDVALLLGFAHHCLYPLDGLLALLEMAGNALCQLLNLALLALLDVLVVEAREDVLLVQLVELARLLGDFGEVFGDLVLDIEPAWRQQVHLYYGIPIVVASAGHEAQTFLGHSPAIAEAIGAGAAIARLLRGMVRVGLAVGYEAVALRQREQGQVVSGSSGRRHAYRLVRSRHMLGWRLQEGYVMARLLRWAAGGSVKGSSGGC